ncbi:MAG: SwmB domain-containing protein, partial [Deltaproteobacteria bacterium]|nr:SwmB domain-containing protein [Deltaproteobacteria bacterium]
MALVLAVLAGLALFAAPPALAQPTVTSATVNGDDLVLTFSQNLGNGLASAAAFTLTAGDEEIALVYDDFSPISTLYIFEAALEKDVHRGVTVKLSYDPALVVSPAVPLSNEANVNVAKFTDIAVSNNTSVHQPLLGSAVVNGAKLTLTYSHELSTAQKPATSAYTVHVGEDARSVTNVRIVPMTKKVELTLASAVTDTDTVKVSYDKPAANPLRGKAASTDAPSFTDYAVTNDTPDATAPKFSSAAVDGKQLKVTFDETLDSDSAPSGGAFTVSATVGGTTRSITGTGTADIDAATVTVVLGSAVLSTETVTVAYAKPTTGDTLQDAASNEVTDFSGQSADNNSDAPEFSSAAVDGKQLKVTFDENLDTGSAPSGG